LATDGSTAQAYTSANEAAAAKALQADKTADALDVQAAGGAVAPSVAKFTRLGAKAIPAEATLVNPNAAAPVVGVQPAAIRPNFLGATRGARACDHTISLTDSYGDGWNGNSVDVLVNGTVVLDDLTIAAGAGPEVTIFQADTGDTIDVIFNETGQYPGECAYEVFDTNGRLLCADGLLDTVPTGCSTTGANCGADPCIGNEPVNDDCTGAVRDPAAVCVERPVPGLLRWPGRVVQHQHAVPAGCLPGGLHVADVLRQWRVRDVSE
jgi:hypothetical protein